MELKETITSSLKDYRKNVSIKYIDKTFWFVFIVLCVISMISLFSAGSSLVYRTLLRGGSYWGPVVRHCAFLVVGIMTAFVVQFIPSRVIRKLSYWVFWISVILLALVYSPLGHSENDANRWLNLFGFSLQPSEIAKLSLIIVVADVLSKMKSPEDCKITFWKVMGYTAIVVGLVLPSNLSTVLLIGIAVFALMYIGRIHWKYLGGLAAVVLIVGGGGFAIAKYGFVDRGKPVPLLGRAETWVHRIDDMREKNTVKVEDIVVDDDNRQSVYASIAVANGGKSFFGVLPGNSVERDYLPLAYADYIFSIMVEESGLFGAFWVIFFYILILSRACRTSSRYDDYGAMLMVMGLALMITSQALLSMCVSVNLGPVTGQPLPLISRGGTSILITSVYFGILMSVSREQNILADKSLEAEQKSANEAPIFLDEDRTAPKSKRDEGAEEVEFTDDMTIE